MVKFSEENKASLARSKSTGLGNDDLPPSTVTNRGDGGKVDLAAGDAKLWWRSRQEADRLKDLKHTNTILEYVKQFMSLMLDISNTSEDDKLFQFMSGLKPWAQTELRRQKVQDLNAAIVAAEALVDWKPSNVADTNNFLRFWDNQVMKRIPGKGTRR
uniref:Retrotransposon gag domain-containing protein n=1 Tax=Chenopodium quinoa TaxID=63459 RepID=A0A803MKE6_CHEQI